MSSEEMHTEMAEVFGPGGILASLLAGYEFRQGQLELAEAIMDCLTGSAGSGVNVPPLLAAEAGTGIGKTLAYLVPAALSGRRVVVSTGTLNLQDQILDKEIPFIKKHIVPDLSAICVKGRQNYLCLYRWKQLASAPQKKLFVQGPEIEAVADWLGRTSFADRAELDWLADDSSFWGAISSSASQCLGSNCPDWSECFVNRLRREAARSRLLIVNHHLFFSDLALRRFGNAEVLPRYEAVIFDEAHHIEETATRYFGISVSHYQIIDLARDIEALGESELSGPSREKTLQLSRALAAQADRLVAILPARPGRFGLHDVVDYLTGWPEELEELKSRFLSMAEQLENLEVTAEAWSGMLWRCLELQGNLQEITEGLASSMIYWLERREKTAVFSASPIQVAEELQEHLYSQVAAAVFVSATLTIGNKFGFFLDRLGLPADIETLTIATPFDYLNRTMLYVPDNRFSLPGTDRFPDDVKDMINRLVTMAGGRTLVLFTSASAMQSAYEYLEARVPFQVLMQGTAPRSMLLETFSSDVHSVLLAVASFWEGVDVPGEALSCVIIDKLPFEVPSDPVVRGRVERIKEEGGKPFFDYQIPRAVLALRQGVGRLMRSNADCGVIAILDTRLFVKSYGRIFLNSLPASPVTRDLAEVTEFWQKIKHEA